jgi:hypothetical protein
VIDHLDTKTLACLVNEPFQSGYSLAELLEVSQATILNRLHNSLGMNNFHVRWVPDQLTSELQATRLANCRELLPMIEVLQKHYFRKVVTGDESWFYLATGHSAQCWVCRDDMATKTKPIISTPKFILTVMWGERLPRHRCDDLAESLQFRGVRGTDYGATCPRDLSTWQKSAHSSTPCSTGQL